MILPKSRVYFARCLTWSGQDMMAIKVGLAIDPVKRAKSVCSQQPYECELVATVPGDSFIEHFVQMWLRAYHLGGEYFRAEGETIRLMDHAREHGELPLPVSERQLGVKFSELDVSGFMARNHLTFRDVEALSGTARGHYQKRFERTGYMNRRMLAALAVAAVKRGVSVQWPLDFIPEKPMQKAA